MLAGQRIAIVGAMQDPARLSKEQLIKVLDEQAAKWTEQLATRDEQLATQTKEVAKRADVIKQLEAKVEELKKDLLPQR